MNKKIVTVFAIVSTLGLGAIGASRVSAQSTPNRQDHMSSLVEKIATKFGLNQAEVQAVFDAEHAERESQMKASFETQLSQYVSEGKITDAQKQLILNKRAEMESSHEAMMESMKDKTPEERRTLMESHRESLESWARENGIDLEYLNVRMKMGHGSFGKFIKKSADVYKTPAN